MNFRQFAVPVALLAAVFAAAVWFLSGAPGDRDATVPVPPRAARPNASDFVKKILAAARANRFEELRRLEDGLAAFGEAALPEIRKALLADGRPHPNPLPEGEGGMHPRAKLHMLAAAARIESERADLFLDEFACTPGPAQEAWLRMTARDMIAERRRGEITNHKTQITKKSQISNLKDGATGDSGGAPSGSAGAEPPGSARLASGPAARAAAAQGLATALREELDRKKRLETIDALVAIPGEEGSRALERYILENKDDSGREWEVNRALRLLIERHGASQELGPFRWVLREEPALALRSIEAAAQTPSAQGLAFLLAVREAFPQGHPLRLRADAAITRRQNQPGR